MDNLFAELKRRHIYRVAAAWVLIPLVNNITPVLNRIGHKALSGRSTHAWLSDIRRDFATNGTDGREAVT
jgi:hypothetical protein